MELKVTIDLDSFLKAFNAIPDIAKKEMTQEIAGVSRSIQNQARTVHRFKTKSGNLARSIWYTIRNKGLSAEIFLNESTAQYGKYVHDGTRAHTIRPQTRKYLYFVSGGNKVFAKKVNHPGINPDQFLYEAAQIKEPDFIIKMNTAVDRVIKLAGF